MPSNLTPPNQNSPITDALQLGAAWPTYTWRKGGTEDPEDNHLWLTISSADTLLVPEDDALIEIDPDTKHVKFWGTTELLEGVSFGENTLEGSSIKDGTVTGDKLIPGIVIDGSITKLTTARNINGILFDGTNNIINYTTCATAGNQTNKDVSVTNFQLITGATITVRFANDNTAPNPTLNVNGTGRYPIRYDRQTIPAEKIVSTRYYTFVYDGTAYNVIGDLATENTDENVTIDPNDSTKTYTLIGTDQSGGYNGHVQLVGNLTFDSDNQLLTVRKITSDANGSWAQINHQNSATINNTSTSNLAGLLTAKVPTGVFSVSRTSNALLATYTTNDLIDDDYNGTSHQVNLLDTSGNSKFPGTVTAPRFAGVADSALNATNDSDGNPISTTYAKASDLGGYLQLSGGTLTGELRVPQIDVETDVRVSTVGWVESQIKQSVDQVKEEIIGTAGDFGTIADLTQQVTENATNIESLQQLSGNFVRFDQAQSLSENQQQQARTNIGAFSSAGGTINGNVTVAGSLTTTNSLAINNQLITTAQPPKSPTHTSFNVGTSTGSTVGSVDVNVDVDNSVMTSLNAKANTTNGTTRSISITSRSDGTVTTSAPHPIGGSNDSSIATTQWVNDAIDDAVKTVNQVLDEKTYQNVLAASTLTTVEQGLIYFSKIIPDNPLNSWQAKYIIDVTCAYDSYNAIAIVELVGIGQTVDYKYTVAHKSTNTISFDGINYRAATTSALAGGNGHYLGLSLYKSTNPDIVGYERTINVKLVQADNCNVELLEAVGGATDVGITSSTHVANQLVDTHSTGFYYTSTTNYGDCLSTWDRLPVAGGDGLPSDTLAGLDNSQQLVPVFLDGAINKVPIDPYSIVYYTGADLAGFETGNVAGTLYTVHRFSLSSIGIGTTLVAGSRLWIKGTIDKSTWLFTGQSIVTAFDDDHDPNVCFLSLGYVGNNGSGYLDNIHILYSLNNGEYVPLWPVPVVTTPSFTSNDTTIATTEFVQHVANQVSTLINPQVYTDNDDETLIYVNAPADVYTRGQTPTNTSQSVTQSIVFRDSTPLSDSNQSKTTIASVDTFATGDQTSISMSVIQPDAQQEDPFIALEIGYNKVGSSWTPYATITESPVKTDNSNAIATTKYVQENMEDINTFLQVIDCGEIP